MKKDLTIKKIDSRFKELISFDQNRRKQFEQQQTKREMYNALTKFTKDVIKKTTEQQKLQKKIDLRNEEAAEFIYTKSDICKEVAKLKPYLKIFGDSQTSGQQQDLTNKEISNQEKNCISDLIIHLNKRLCEELRQSDQRIQKNEMKRQNKEKQGWVYEVFYRVGQNKQSPSQLNNTIFKNGYIVLTEMLELYPNLTFHQVILKMNINEVKRIKYFQEKEYQIIDIRFHVYTLHIGFLSQNQMKLFDRMLFLIKNMARTSSNRLFQNQLLKNIYFQYSEYQ